MPVFKLLFFDDVKNKLRKNFVVPVMSDKGCLSTQISYDLDKIYLSFAMLKENQKSVLSFFQKQSRAPIRRDFLRTLILNQDSKPQGSDFFYSGLDQKSHIRGMPVIRELYP